MAIPFDNVVRVFAASEVAVNHPHGTDDNCFAKAIRGRQSQILA